MEEGWSEQEFKTRARYSCLHPAALAMIATKPNPAAAPSPHYRAAPEPPPFPLADSCPPRLPSVTYSCLALASPHGRFGFCLPLQQFTPPVLGKGVLAAPWHGRPPHQFTAAFSGPCSAGERPAGAMSPAVSVWPRTKSRSRSEAKAPRPRKATVPRSRLTAWHGVKLKPSELGETSTIMLRNNPRKTRGEDKMKFLDEENCSRVNRAAMVATKPIPAAAPSPHYRAAPEPPPFPLTDACPPRVPLVTYSCLASPHGRFGFCFPVQQSALQGLGKGVLPAPWHGRPPHKFTAAFCGPCGEEKSPAGAAAAILPAASVPTQVPAAPRKPRSSQQKSRSRSRSQAKASRPRKAAVRRASLAAWHGLKLKASELGKARTIMLRNIPKKIRSEDLMTLLDEHCSRVNRAAGAVIAAYDVVYVPMYFRKEVNFGYALINFTTSAAVNGLYYSLENCGWNEHYGSKTAIKIYQAKQQGKAKLLQHLKKLMLKCDNKFLPVKLSPPRDGVSVPAEPRRIRCRSRNRKQYGSSKAIGIDQVTQQLQFCIKPWSSVSVSVQVDIAKMTVGSLIQSTYKKLGTSVVDSYAVLEGKSLDDDEYLSRYPIVRDSTVEIRLRLRAGQPTKTFDEQFNMTLAEMFYEVQLPPLVQKQGEAVPITSVKFFSYKSTCYLHELLKYVTGTHRDGDSFNGAFDSIDIIWLHGRVHILCAKVPFGEESCRRDFYKLYEIFSEAFLPHGYPTYFEHLLEYLRTCPASQFSNREALIGFVTNHPCLQHYTDRMKQIMVLANMLPRLNRADQQILRAALGDYTGWQEYVHGVPDMDRIFFHQHVVDAAGHVIVNPMYTDTPMGGIHYSNNYMKHAELQVWTEALEAAYCLHFKDFLPEMLQRMARCLYHLQWVTGLICNRLADKRSKERKN